MTPLRAAPPAPPAHILWVGRDLLVSILGHLGHSDLGCALCTCRATADVADDAWKAACYRRWPLWARRAEEGAAAAADWRRTYELLELREGEARCVPDLGAIQRLQTRITEAHRAILAEWLCEVRARALPPPTFPAAAAASPRPARPAAGLLRVAPRHHRRAQGRRVPGPLPGRHARRSAQPVRDSDAQTLARGARAAPRRAYDAPLTAIRPRPRRFQLIGIACLRVSMADSPLPLPAPRRPSDKLLDADRFAHISDDTYTAAEVEAHTQVRLAASGWRNRAAYEYAARARGCSPRAPPARRPTLLPPCPHPLSRPAPCQAVAAAVPPAVREAPSAKMFLRSFWYRATSRGAAAADEMHVYTAAAFLLQLALLDGRAAGWPASRAAAAALSLALALFGKPRWPAALRAYGAYTDAELAPLRGAMAAAQAGFEAPQLRRLWHRRCRGHEYAEFAGEWARLLDLMACASRALGDGNGGPAPAPPAHALAAGAAAPPAAAPPAALPAAVAAG
jgi:hypothetical protein